MRRNEVPATSPKRRRRRRATTRRRQQRRATKPNLTDDSKAEQCMIMSKRRPDFEACMTRNKRCSTRATCSAARLAAPAWRLAHRAIAQQPQVQDSSAGTADDRALGPANCPTVDLGNGTGQAWTIMKHFRGVSTETQETLWRAVSDWPARDRDPASLAEEITRRPSRSCSASECLQSPKEIRSAPHELDHMDFAHLLTAARSCLTALEAAGQAASCLSSLH